MESYKSRQLPYIEKEKYALTKEYPKTKLLNSEKIKEITTTPSRIPSCVSTSQEYQIENNKLPKSKSSQKQNNQNKINYIIFKNCYENKKDMLAKKNSKDNRNNIKQANSFDKIKNQNKNNINLNNIKITNNLKNEKKSFIEKNLNKKENVKNEMNEIMQNFVDNKLQNSKNCNFFRLFKMKRKNQNSNKDEKFPPLMANAQPLETEQNVINKNKNENRYKNLLTTQNDDNTIHYRDNLLNSVNRKKKENKIFIKIDEHFNKVKNDKSPKLVKKCYQGVIKNVNPNNNNNSNAISLSNNNKSKSKYININNEPIPKGNHRALTHDKYIDKNNKSKERKNTISDIKIKEKNNKTPNITKKGQNLNLNNNKKNKNKIKIKLNTPKSNNIFANKEEFDIKKSKENLNLNRKNTPNYNIVNDDISNTIQIKNSHNNIKNKINFDLDENKVKNKKMEITEDNNAIHDSFIDEINNIFSDDNNTKKEKGKTLDDENLNNDDDSMECFDEIKLNLNDINHNDDSIEKNIPKEQIERINLIKKYNRPDTSYGRQKK